MGFKEDLFIPQSPKNFPIRPLNKGIIKHLPSNALPLGAFLNAKNVIIGTQGPLRRPGLQAVGGTTSFLFPPLRGILTLTSSDGTQTTIAFDEKLLYSFTALAYTAYTWDYDTGTVAISSGSASVAGTNNVWNTANKIQARDIFVVGSGGTLERIPIKSVGSTTALTLVSNAVNTHGAGASYTIHRAFKAINPYMVSHTRADNLVIFADSSRALYSFDGSTFEPYDAGLTFVPACVEFFQDRLFCGHIGISAADHRQRIAWSTVTDHTDIDPETNYLDLDYGQGDLRRLKGMGNLLIAYLEDAIYYGRQTNIAGNTLPFGFETIETGGVGLVGMNALCSHTNGHFFVGQDDIYFFSNKGLERIGTPIISETIEKSSNPWTIYATMDPVRKRLVIGFPESGSEEITKLWSFEYNAKAWSYDEVPCSCISGLSYVETTSWDSLDPTTWDDLTYPSWDSIRGSSFRKFFIGKAGRLWEFLNSSTTDNAAGGNIPIEIETADYDDNLPDIKKVTTKLSIKIDRVLESDLVFGISWSTDRGRTWSTVQNAIISSGDDEAFVNFLASGSTIRFKIKSDSNVEQYRIIELVRRTKGKGLEVHLGPSD